jgi:hypothetical protein
VRAMNDAVQNGIADRRVAHEFVPASYGNLWLVTRSEPFS